jgi:hypothetical protein
MFLNNHKICLQILSSNLQKIMQLCAFNKNNNIKCCPYHEFFIYNTFFLKSKLLYWPYKFCLCWSHFCLRSLSIGQMSNLWPQPNKNYPFHWTLDLHLKCHSMSFLFGGIYDHSIFLCHENMKLLCHSINLSCFT